MPDSANEVIVYTIWLGPHPPYDFLIAIPSANINFVFDWDHGRVGLAESSCEFEDKHSAENLESADGAEGKTESMDRKLKRQASRALLLQSEFCDLTKVAKKPEYATKSEAVK